LGDAQEELGDLEKALENQQEALELWRNTRDQVSVAQTLVREGRLLYKRGEYEKATKSFTEALKTFRRLGLKNDEGKAIAFMGRSLAGSGNYRSALKYAEEAQVLLAETKDTKNEAETWYDMGIYETELKEYGEADTAFGQAEKLFGQIENVEESAEGKGLPGRVRCDLHVAGRRVLSVGRKRDGFRELQERLLDIRKAGRPTQHGPSLQ
jgi:tetratricopeptide (TPR) repeat protein